MFGESVIEQAKALRESGLDANQIAGILCKKDPQGKNYGIGIVLGKDGKPLPTSPTLLRYVEKELRESALGQYANSDGLKSELKEAVLRWQGVPEKYWPNIQLLLPSDAGTGAVQTALQAAQLLSGNLSTLSVESFGWPAYKALAASVKLGFHEYMSDGVAEGVSTLALYQAGPMNTTGKVPSKEIVGRRVEATRKAGLPVVLDRAYTAFEFARRLTATNYGEILAESFAQQVLPFWEAGVPVCVAISPTKAFVTFSLRPCGLLLIFHPERSALETLSAKLAGLIRARGSSFEHPITRAFVKALVHDRAALENEHALALRRTAESELQWQNLTRGTAMESLFSDQFAGLFRNPKAKADAPREIYGAHVYPVFSEGRCRLNVTGLPINPEEAREQVQLFARYCTAD